MPNPQNPELRRSEESLRPRPELGPDPHDVGGEGGGPVPPDNRPGHHPDEEQDKPPAEAFAEALGIKSDTEVEAEQQEAEEAEPTRSGRARPGKKAPARKAAKSTASGSTANKAAAGGSTASGSGAGRSAAKKDAAKKDAAKKAPAKRSPAVGTPRSAGRATPTGEAAREAAMKVAAPLTQQTSPAATGPGGSASTDPGRVNEDPEVSAAQHHHALPDDQLPHDAGMVTPAGTPVTIKVLTLPLRYWGAVLRTSGTVVTAYARFVKRAGGRLIPGRDHDD